jgi:16S rRNA (guanine527-N7)-methyltransferase
VSPAHVQALEEYVRLLARWNEKINLTALLVTDPDDQAIDRLLVEPISAARYLPDESRALMDVGSGSGSPAIPLSIVRPELSVTMVESKTRKAVFLTEVVRHLGLDRVRVETARFEQLLARPEMHEAFDVVTVRAVRVETRTLLTLQAFVRPGGQMAWFRSGRGSPENVPPPLRLTGSRLLLEWSDSQLVVLEKDVVAMR